MFLLNLAEARVSQFSRVFVLLFVTLKYYVRVSAGVHLIVCCVYVLCFRPECSFQQQQGKLEVPRSPGATTAARVFPLTFANFPVLAFIAGWVRQAMSRRIGINSIDVSCRPASHSPRFGRVCLGCYFG